jgi:hypothetical protein
MSALPNSDIGNASDPSDQQLLEAFRAADEQKRAMVLNLLRLFDAWEHPREGAEFIIKQCLANLDLPSTTTHAEAELVLHILAERTSRNGDEHPNN